MMKNGTIELSEIAGEGGLFVDGDWIETKHQDVNGDVRLIQMMDIGDGKYLNKSSRFLTSETAKQLRCTFLQPGDVLISRMPDPLGRACIFPGDERPCVTAVDVCIARPDPNIVNNNWLKYRLNSLEFRAKISRWATGTTRARISRGNLGKLTLSLPKLEEQKRIATILSKADSIRRRRLAIAEESQRLSPAIFHQMFREVAGRLSGKHIVKKDSTAGIKLVEKGWKRTTIGEEITLQRGIDITKKEHILGDVPVISSGGVNGFHNEAIAKGPGVVLGRKGSVGSVHYVDVDYWPHDTTLWVREFNGNAARFVYEFFRQFPISKYEASTANPSLNRNNIHPVSVWWPPVPEQKRFADYCNAVDKRLGPKLTLAADEADDLFNSLVQRAFNGEL